MFLQFRHPQQRYLLFHLSVSIFRGLLFLYVFEDFQDYGSYDLVNNNINVRDNDYVGFAVARKEVGDNVIYCVPIKGTGGNSEWFSDFNLGDPDSNGGWHEGFLKCELPLILRLKTPVLCKFYKTGFFLILPLPRRCLSPQRHISGSLHRTCCS